MAVDVSKIPNNNKFDPVRQAILDLQGEISGGVAGVGSINGVSGSVTLTGLSPITVTSNTSTSQITIGINQSLLSITESQISDLGNYLDLDDTGEQTIAGDIVISGDLTISGTTTFIDTTHLNIGDNIITLNADLPSGTAPTENAGVAIYRGSSATVTFLWNETSDKWTLGSETLIAGTFEGNVVGDVTGDLTGNADTASALETARNIAVDGAVTGNADFDGSGNITITTSVNHNHDDRYYTETESDNRFVNVDGDTMTDDLNFDSGSRVRLHSGAFTDANDRYEIFATGDVMFLQYYDDDQGNGTSLQKVVLSLDGTTSQREATLFGDLRLKSGNVANPTYDAVVLDIDKVNGHVDITNVRNGSFSGDLTATTNLIVGTTNVYDNLPDGITYSTTDNRLKIGVSKNLGSTTETAIQPILLANLLTEGYVPYVATGGAGSATVNSKVSDSWLKLTSDTLQLGASDPISHEIKYARFLWQSGQNDKISTVYGARDIIASIQYLGGSKTAKIEFTTGSGGGRIQFNDEYTFPATDGTSGQVLSTNGSGDLSWVAAGGPTTSDLQDVTTNGATTSNAISIYNSDAAANPRLSLGRGSTERLKFSVEDRVATITHQQDESTGSHEMIFTIDSPAASKIFKWQQRLADGSSANQLMSLTSGELNTLNVTSTGYLQAYSYLYTRDNLLVLDSAGTGWNTWASRTSNGLYNLDVDSEIQFFNGQSGVPAAALSYNSNGFIYLKGGGGGVAIGNDDFGGAVYVNDNSTIALVAGSSTVADISAGSFGINNPLNVYNSATIHGSQVWSESTQGLTTGSIHIDPATGTDHAGGAITFGASDAAAGTNAQAGIYVRSDGAYGTKMYFSTTDSYATGSKTAMSIDQNGLVTINPRLDGAKSFKVYYDMDIYNTVNFTDASWNFKGSIRGNSSGDVIIRSGSAVETTFRSDGYLFAPTWINIDSGAGIYSSTNSAHFYPNTYSNYGTWRIDGERGNYSGILVNDVSAMPHIMYDNSGNGGLYNQGNGRWSVYYEVGNDCVAIGGSATSSGWKARVNGNIYVDTNVYAGTQVQASTATMGDLGSYARFGSNSATRGIVLSRDGTNYDFYVTPDGNTKVNKGLIDGVGKRMPIVGGGSYTTTTSSVTGAIKISLPTTRYKSNTMMTFKVVVYEYNTGHTYEFRISGYNYSDAGATWYNESAINLTDDGKNLNVRFGHDGTKNIVWIGETNTVWSYPQVFVEDLTTGYSGISQDDWADGWDVGFTTSFDSVSRNRATARIGKNSIIDSLTVNNTVGIGTSGFGSTDLSINSGSNYPIQINTTQRYAVGFQNTSTSESGNYPWLAHEYVSKTTGAYSSMIVHFNGIGDKFFFNRLGDFEAARDISNDGWYYNNSSSGMYWTDYGYGFRSANGAGVSYGNIATYNAGKGGWDGYSLHRSNMSWMGTTADCGLYNADLGDWIVYYVESTRCTGIGTSTTSSSYKAYVGGSLYATGDIVAYSDRRVKENIINIDSALDKVKALQGVYYNRINDKDKVREIGFIAQDVHDAVPELASYAEDVDEWGVKYSQVTGLHNEAIKELAQELDKKDEQIANLQAQIDELKQLILNK